MIDFTEAEAKFRELQGRVQRGEPLSEEQYQEELAKLMVQDDQGIFWSLEPGTGRWLFFNGTEWVPGTPPRPAPPAEVKPPVEAPVEPAPTPAPTTPAPQLEYMVAPEVPPIEAETVPTYVRTGDVREPAPAVQGPAGIPPRPVRGTFVGMAEGDRPWLPFAIGAIVLMLCAVALFFGVRNAPFLASASPTATSTEVAILENSPTEDIVPTDVPAPTETSVPEVPTASVVTVTTTDNVRVRAGPGTKFGVLLTVANGTSLTATGRISDNSWIQIQQPGKSDLGWVSADFVTISGDVSSLPIVQTQSTPAPAKGSPTKKPASPKPTATETPAG